MLLLLLLLAMVGISRIGGTVDEVVCSDPLGSTMRRVLYV
jgi:hypothetical protein